MQSFRQINMSVLLLLTTARSTTPRVKSPQEYTEQEVESFAATNTWPHKCPSCKEGKLSPQVCSTCLHS